MILVSEQFIDDVRELIRADERRESTEAVAWRLREYMADTLGQSDPLQTPTPNHGDVQLLVVVGSDSIDDDGCSGTKHRNIAACDMVADALAFNEINASVDVIETGGDA